MSNNSIPRRVPYRNMVTYNIDTRRNRIINVLQSPTGARRYFVQTNIDTISVHLETRDAPVYISDRSRRLYRTLRQIKPSSSGPLNYFENDARR